MLSVESLFLNMIMKRDGAEREGSMPTQGSSNGTPHRNNLNGEVLHRTVPLQGKILLMM